jgi:hypothetical protein
VWGLWSGFRLGLHSFQMRFDPLVAFRDFSRVGVVKLQALLQHEQ